MANWSTAMISKKPCATFLAAMALELKRVARELKMSALSIANDMIEKTTTEMRTSTRLNAVSGLHRGRQGIAESIVESRVESIVVVFPAALDAIFGPI